MNTTKLEKIDIVDKLCLDQFRKDYGEAYNDYEVKAGIFLTYSIEPIVILTLLHSLFFEKDNIIGSSGKKKSREETAMLLGTVIKDIYGENPIEDRFKDKFAVFYNNGSKPVEKKLSLADSLAMRYAYPVTVEGASFHPKVYIVKYGSSNSERGKEYIYRFIIGSHNLANSGCIEYGYSFDKGIKQEQDDNSWNWLKQLFEGVSVINYMGNKMASDVSEIAVFKEVLKHTPKDMPEILVDFEKFDDKIKKVNSICSPFLSKLKLQKMQELNKDLVLYTTHVELEKRGFVQCEAGTENAKMFKVFSPEEGTLAAEYSMPHYKIYQFKDCAYAGSLNYTDSAFDRNKEVLVKLPNLIDFKEFKEWYQEVYYCTQKSGGKEGSLADKFKLFVRNNLSKGNLSLDKNDGFVLELETDNKSYNKDNSFEGTLLKVHPEYIDNYVEVNEFWNKIPPKIFWDLKKDEFRKLRSNCICFELWKDEELIATACRSYMIKEDSCKTFKDNLEIEDIVSFFRIHIGLVNNSDGGDGKSSRTVVTSKKLREYLYIHTAEELLLMDIEKRSDVVKIMKQRVDLLDKLMSDRQGNEEILTRVGCRAGEHLVWKNICGQAKKMIEVIDTKKDEGNK